MIKEKRIIKKLINPLFIFEFNRIRIELQLATHKQEIEEYIEGLTFNGNWNVYHYKNNFHLTKHRILDYCIDSSDYNYKIIDFKTQKEAFNYIEKVTKRNKMKQRILDLFRKKFDFTIEWNHDGNFENWEGYYIWKI